MDFETIFSIGNNGVLLAWLAIVAALFLPKARTALLAFSGLVVPAILAVAYIALLTHSMTSGTGEGGSFGSLAGIKALFADDGAMTAGWYHYLAFDVFVGTWIAKDGLERGLDRGAWRLIIIPILFATLMFGPAGLLIYLVIRTVFLRRAKGPAVS